MYRIKLDLIEWALLVILVLATGCGARAVFIGEFTQQTKMAVLPFKSTGDKSSQNHGLFCSAILNRELVLQRKARVVDNSVTNAKLTEMDIRSIAKLKHGVLRRLANELDVDVLITGDLQTWQNENAELSFETGATNYLLTMRFLDPATGLVLGVITHEKRGKKQPKVILAEMIQSVAGKIKLVKIETPEPGETDETVKTEVEEGT